MFFIFFILFFDIFISFLIFFFFDIFISFFIFPRVRKKKCSEICQPQVNFPRKMNRVSQSNYFMQLLSQIHSVSGVRSVMFNFAHSVVQWNWNSDIGVLSGDWQHFLLLSHFNAISQARQELQKTNIYVAYKTLSF